MTEPNIQAETPSKTKTPYGGFTNTTINTPSSPAPDPEIIGFSVGGPKIDATNSGMGLARSIPADPILPVDESPLSHGGVFWG